MKKIIDKGEDVKSESTRVGGDKTRVQEYRLKMAMCMEWKQENINCTVLSLDSVTDLISELTFELNHALQGEDNPDNTKHDNFIKNNYFLLADIT